MSLPSRAYIQDVQRVFADVIKNAEGNSIEFDTVIARVHQRVRPGKRKPSLSHKKWTLDAVIYEASASHQCRAPVHAYRLTVNSEDDPQLVTITTTGSAYYFDLVTSSIATSGHGRVTKKDAITQYLAAAAVLEPIKDAVAEFASMNPAYVPCVETFPEFILQHLELQSRLQDESEAMIDTAQKFDFELDLVHNEFLSFP